MDLERATYDAVTAQAVRAVPERAARFGLGAPGSSHMEGAFESLWGSILASNEGEDAGSFFRGGLRRSSAWWSCWIAFLEEMPGWCAGPGLAWKEAPPGDERVCR